MKSCSTLSVLAVSGIGLSLALIPRSAQAQPSPTAVAQMQHATIPGPLPASNSIKSAGSEGAATAPAVPEKSRIIALGTTIVAEFAGSLNVRKLKPGDKVKAVLAQDLLAGGKIIARVDSKLIGHVTEIKRRSESDPESRLGIVFDKILLKKHQEADFQAIVQALAPPVLRRSRVDEPDQMMPPPVMSVGSSSPGPSGRGSNSSSSRTASTTTSLATAVSTMGSMTTVGSTPGSNPGDAMSTIRTTSSSNAPASGGVGMHGVYGLKNLALRPPESGAESGPAIVSTRSDVKLENGTQVVLLVVN